MYFYIIDPQKLNPKTFERVQAQLYSCLSEYRINGEIGRVTSVRTIPQLVESAFQFGVKTLVAVGTDETLQETVNAVKGRDVTIAYVPIAESELGSILGVNGIDIACRAIANRLTQQLDLGQVNGQWFFTRVQFGTVPQSRGVFGIFSGSQAPSIEIKFTADSKYNATTKITAGIIANARDNRGGNPSLANPTDSVLDLMLLPDLSGIGSLRHKKDLGAGHFENIPGTSFIHLKRLEITDPPGLEIKSGEKVIATVPAVIEVLPKALKMIVGRERTF